MNVQIGAFKVNHVAGAGTVNIGITFNINPSSNTKNQIGMQNNGDGNTIMTNNPIYDPDVNDSPVYVSPFPATVLNQEV